MKSKALSNLLLFVAMACVAMFLYNRYRVSPDFDSQPILVQNEKGMAESLEKKNTLVTFYACWCPMCIAKIPWLNAQHESGLRVVAVTDDSTEKIEAVRNEYGVKYPILRLAETLKDNKIYTLPTTYIFNEKGREIYAAVEQFSEDDPKLKSALISIGSAD